MAVVIEHRPCLLSFRDVHYIAVALSIFLIRAFHGMHLGSAQV